MSRPNSQGSQNEGKAQEAAIEKVSLSDEIVIDEATNKRIVRKIDWRLMPIVRPPPCSRSFHPYSSIPPCFPVC